MAIANVNVRIDRDVKESAENIFSQLGISMSSAINMFLRQTIRDNGLPFTPALNKYGPETVAAVREGRMIAADASVKSYSDMDELRKALES